MPVFDLIAMGRSGIDLYAEQVGAAFVDVESFAAYVGGSPANIAVGARRLGLRTALLTGGGDDPVGDFIVAFLAREGIETRYIPRKPRARSGAVLLAMQPPDRFPLVHYRANAADLQLGIDDVLAVPLAEARVEGDVEAAVAVLLGLGPQVLVEKRGAAGSRVHRAGGGRVDVPGFPVTVQNTLGAGDAFAAGFVYGYLQGWDDYRAARFGNACGALLVTRHGCSASAPALDEVTAFVDAHGGL